MRSGIALGQRRERSLHLHEADALEFDLATLDDGRGLRIVGNLPYNIFDAPAIPLIEQRAHIRDMHVMLQKEVVDRMAAAPDSEHTDASRSCSLRGLRSNRYSTSARRLPSAAAGRVDVRAARAARGAVAHRGAAPLRECRGSGLLAATQNVTERSQGDADQEEIRAAGIDPGVRAETIPAAGFAALAAQLALKKSQSTVLT
jgi:16S rRNA (adenine1518-N6/adenine1519-N6)-dimethyltransferase